MSAQTVSERFAADTAEHQMAVALDEGLHRHLRFRAPKTGLYWFDVVTWPGNLVLTGDMGSFHFARIDDMFEFFRGAGQIDLRYWAEKLRATSGTKAYSEQRFRRLVTEAIEENARTYGDPVDAHVLAELDDWDVSSEWGAREFLDNFAQRRGLQDTYEWDLTEFTAQFLWSCAAIRYAIRQYDAYAVSRSTGRQSA